ncbi:MAG: hypothetical protein MN733_29535, partial [Nitrososphaera sp.]|nr:hypothetical protein [Nitrososphaera sp.]
MDRNLELERQQARERGVDFGRAEVARFTSERGRVDSSGRLATPLLREAVRDMLRTSTDDDASLKRKLDGFWERISFTLSQHGGRPSNFLKLWAELEFDQDDIETLFFLTLHEMLHAILSALSGVPLDAEETEEPADASGPSQKNESSNQSSKALGLIPEDATWL